jgi:hypothetical protein
VGYAVGTAQVLVVDWWRGVASHRRSLRLLHAELERSLLFDHKFQYSMTTPPKKERPRPPLPTDKFLDTVAAADFGLTDEHVGDNSIGSFLSTIDSCNLLVRYADRVEALQAEIMKATTLPGSQEALDLWESAVEQAKAYDALLDRVRAGMVDALFDIERRLLEARFIPQVVRKFRPLKRGVNPPRMTDDDSRIPVLLAKYSERQVGTGVSPRPLTERSSP